MPGPIKVNWDKVFIEPEPSTVATFFSRPGEETTTKYDNPALAGYFMLPGEPSDEKSKITYAPKTSPVSELMAKASRLERDTEILRTDTHTQKSAKVADKETGLQKIRQYIIDKGIKVDQIPAHHSGLRKLVSDAWKETKAEPAAAAAAAAATFRF